MPPRFAYWTILIDDTPTAFRAQYKEDLQPTLVQLLRTNPNAVMRWFAKGRLWDNPEQAQWAARNMTEAREKRSREWRPGGEHKDPRARFDKRRRETPRASGVGVPPERHGEKRVATTREPPRSAKPPDGSAGSGPPARPENRGKTPWRPKSSGHPFAKPGGKEPWRRKPAGRPFTPSRRDGPPSRKPGKPGRG